MISIEPFGLPVVADSPSPVNSSDESLSYPGAELFDELDDGELGPKRRNRKGAAASTAERRATHNAVERARRETLNTRFQELAIALPNMANVKRPSKSAIVNKSIEYVQTSQAREKALAHQNDSLRAEINELRARLGMSPLSPTPAAAPALPAARPRELSVTSIRTTSENASPLLSGGSPPSVASFDTTTSHLAAANAFLLSGTATPDFLSGFASPTGDASRKLSAAGSDSGSLVGSPLAESMPVATSAAPQAAVPAFNMGQLGAADLGYWMGLQAQPNALVNALHVMNMQTGHGLAGMPQWQNPFPQMPAVSAGGNDSMNWLFA